MSWDEEIAACSRRCSATGRAIAPGETYFSLLESSAGGIARRDFASPAWAGPPPSAVGWWKSRLPQAHEGPRAAPEEVLLQLFEHLAADRQQASLRFLLGLLLLRKKILRVTETKLSPDGRETWLLAGVRTAAVMELAVQAPVPEEAPEIQARLLELVYGPTDVRSSNLGRPPLLEAAERGADA
jgi:hypothetical protein